VWFSLVPLAIWGLLLALRLRGLLRLQLDIDETGIRGIRAFTNFEVRWQDVAWVSIQNYKGNLVVVLLTREGEGAIPLHSFDSQAVCDLIRSYLPAAVFEQEALDKFAQEEKQRILSETWPLDRTFRVRIAPTMCIVWWVCVVAWFLIIGFLIFDQGYDPVLLFFSIFFFLGAFFLFLFSRTMEIDGQRIIERNWFGKYTVQWSEVEKVKTDKVFSVFVMEGHGKRFTCNGPFWWGGADAREAERLFLGEFERRDMSLKENQSLGGCYIPWPHASTKVPAR